MDRFIKIGEDGERLAADAAKWLAVLDTTSNLMWDAGESKRLTFKKAQTYVGKLDVAGFKDWRLPSVEELFCLADRTRVDPAIDTAFFPDCKSDWYWSGTLWANSPGDCAWYVYFSYGGSACGGQTYDYYVRAVRASQ